MNSRRNCRWKKNSHETDAETLSDNEKKKSNRSLENCFIQLSNCKDKGKRENALSSIVQTLTMALKPEFVENNIMTVVYECLFCNKKGSAPELQSSLQAIGLLLMIVDDGKSAHEVYKDLVPVISNGLESTSNKVKILQCLAIVTFFGARSLEETEKAMKIIRDILNADNNSKSPAVLSAAVSAWSFLLTTVKEWSLRHRHWQGAVSYFLKLLDEDDESVYASAGEALALISEIDCLQDFSTEKQSFTAEDDIIEKLKGQARKASEEREKQEAAMAVIKFFKEGNLETYDKIGKHNGIKLSTWHEMLKLKFFRNFLGEDGFVKHMKENEKLQGIFDFKPKEKVSTGKELYNPDREEMKFRVYEYSGLGEEEEDGFIRKKSCQDKQLYKRMTKSPNSFLNKARSRFLNEQRMRWEESRFGHNDIDE